MTWDDIEQQQVNDAEAKLAKDKKLEKARALAQTYYRLFSTEDGKKVLEDLMDQLVINNNTPLESQNINYVAAYRNGEAGSVKYILNEIKKAEIL